MAEKKVWSQRSYRVAIRRQSFNLLNVFPIRCRRLYRVLPKENAIFLVLRGVCRLSSPWLSEIPAANSRHNLRLPETYRYREEGTGERLNLCSPDLPFSQQKQDGPPVAVTSGMKFGIQSSFCTTDETWRIPFLSRIAAVR